MKSPSLVLLVKFKSRLSLEEVTRVVEARAREFAALEGLEQKYYLRDQETGEYAGLYLWDSRASLDSYNESALRATIASAYEVEGQPRIEVYEVIRPLREQG